MKTAGIIIAVTVLFVFAVLICRRAFRRLADKKLETYQNELLERHYEEVENMYRQVRGWRHDYKNHIQVMKNHLEAKEYGLLSDYLKTLNGDLIEIDTVLKTGNVMADAILNSKLTLAKSKGIETSAAAKLPETLSVSQTDFCVIVSNLMDNAIEAVMQIAEEEKRFIRVYVGIFKGQLYISVSNSVGTEIKKIAKTYYTTKGEGHGFGLKRIDKIAAKYGGYVNRQDEGDVFATEVMLPI